MNFQPSKRLVNTREYHLMAKAGILTEKDKVELIEGEIIQMSPKGSKHSACIRKLNTLLHKQIPDYFIISIQDPILLNDFSEPEPDLAVLAYSEDFYSEKHPSPEEVMLVVEVADSSLDYDRRMKLPLYASAKIPEYWIVNIAEKELEVYKGPKGNTYQIKYKAKGDEIVSHPLLKIAIKLSDIF